MAGAFVVGFQAVCAVCLPLFALRERVAASAFHTGEIGGLTSFCLVKTGAFAAGRDLGVWKEGKFAGANVVIVLAGLGDQLGRFT